MSAHRVSDLLVVGGGPAGAMLALLAARSGLRVRLAERAAFPRPKACGGVISPRGVAVLAAAGLLPVLRRAGAAPIRALHVIPAPGARAVLPYGDGLALERERLDACLIEAAASTGVDVRCGARVEAVEAGGGARRARVRVRAADGRAETLESSWVAGTGGGSCPVRRAFAGADSAAGGGAWAAVAVTAILEGAGVPAGICEMHLVGSGYAGVAAAGPGLTTVGIVLPAESWRRLGRSLKEALAGALDAYPALGAALRSLPVARGPWATGSLRTAPPASVPPGIVLAGDALARMEPITGEGMAEALEAARAAAFWIARALDPLGAPLLHRRLVARLARARRRSARAAALARSPLAVRRAVSAAIRVPALARFLGGWLAGAPALLPASAPLPAPAGVSPIPGVEERGAGSRGARERGAGEHSAGKRRAERAREADAAHGAEGVRRAGESRGAEGARA